MSSLFLDRKKCQFTKVINSDIDSHTERNKKD